MKGVERENRDGPWYRHGPSHRHVSPEVRNIGGGGSGMPAGCHNGVGKTGIGSM